MRQLHARAVGNRKFLNKKMGSGLLFLSVGVAALWIASDYPMGSAQNMDSGYFPRIVSVILIVLGCVDVILGLVFAGNGQTSPARTRWQAWVFILMALLSIGLLIESLGVVVATLTAVVIGSFASDGMTPKEVLLTALLIVLLVISIFIGGLGLPIPVWPEW